MIFKRLWWTIRLCMIGDSMKRADYARASGIYGFVGKQVSIMPRIVPLYSELIKINDNVIIASNVTFLTHDAINYMLNNCAGVQKKFKERIGCIEIGKNSFIGGGSTILYDVKIGENVIVGADSFVNHDLPSNGVYAGCPARKIGDYADYVNKRMKEEEKGLITTTEHQQHLTAADIKAAWKHFYEKRNSDIY